MEHIHYDHLYAKSIAEAIRACTSSSCLTTYADRGGDLRRRSKLQGRLALEGNCRTGIISRDGGTSQRILRPFWPRDWFTTVDEIMEEGEGTDEERETLFLRKYHRVTSPLLRNRRLHSITRSVVNYPIRVLAYSITLFCHMAIRCAQMTSLAWAAILVRSDFSFSFSHFSFGYYLNVLIVRVKQNMGLV